MMPAGAPTALEVLEGYRPYVRVPFHSRLAALLCFGLAFLIYAAALWLSWLTYDSPIDPLVILLFPSGLLCVAGRRLLLPNVFDLLRNNSRRPVLYLRSFANDDIPNTPREVASIFTAFWLGWPRWAFRALKSLLSFEAQLSAVLWKIGPVLSLSRQEEMLNLPTACRFKVDDDHWKGIVRELIAAAQLIVVDASGSTGVRWEVEQASSMETRRKMVIALATGRTKGKRSAYAYNHICELVSEVFGHRLPDRQEDLALISFDRHGRLREHRLRDALFWSRIVRGGTAATLLQVLRQSGVGLASAHGPRLHGPAAVTAMVVALVSLVVLSHTLTAALVGWQFGTRVAAFRTFDNRWKQTLIGSVRELRAGRETPEGVANVIEQRILPQVIAEYRQLATESTLVPRLHADLKAELKRYWSMTIRSLQDYASALRKGDEEQLRAAGRYQQSAESLLKEFLNKTGLLPPQP